MDFVTLVRSRLTTLGHAQKDLAQAAQVADSYVSQLLTRKRSPPAPDRTDIYPKMEAFLRLEALDGLGRAGLLGLQGLECADRSVADAAHLADSRHRALAQRFEHLVVGEIRLCLRRMVFRWQTHSSLAHSGLAIDSILAQDHFVRQAEGCRNLDTPGGSKNLRVGQTDAVLGERAGGAIV